MQDSKIVNFEREIKILVDNLKEDGLTDLASEFERNSYLYIKYLRRVNSKIKFDYNNIEEFLKHYEIAANKKVESNELFNRIKNDDYYIEQEKNIRNEILYDNVLKLQMGYPKVTRIIINNIPKNEILDLDFSSKLFSLLNVINSLWGIEKVEDKINILDNMMLPDTSTYFNFLESNKEKILLQLVDKIYRNMYLESVKELYKIIIELGNLNISNICELNNISLENNKALYKIEPIELLVKICLLRDMNLSLVKQNGMVNDIIYMSDSVLMNRYHINLDELYKKYFYINNNESKSLNR